MRELLLESQDANEYAFALGALSHYASDIAGHPAVNQSVAIEFPKLRAKFGQSVRYAQDKTAHLKIEFGFDTVQVAKNRYASQQYRAASRTLSFADFFFRGLGCEKLPIPVRLGALGSRVQFTSFPDRCTTSIARYG